MQRKLIKQMTPEELRAYNRLRQRHWREKAKADPEKAARLAQRAAAHTAKWLAGVKSDDERRAAYEARTRERSKERYWRDKNSPQVKSSGLQRTKNPP